MSGFLGRGPRVSDEQKKRIPPGQYFTEKWPVLHYGSVPRVDLKTWNFKVWGEVDNPFEFAWAEFKPMPRKPLHTDIHCVTRWSRLDMDFEGVAIQTILERAKLRPTARFVVIHAEQGYTTNLPLEVLDDDDVHARRHRRRCAARRPTTATRCASSFQSATSGRAPSGSAASSSRRSTSPASGSATATTTTPIPGRKSASPTTENFRCQEVNV